MRVLTALVAALALIAPTAGDETQSCSAGAHDHDGAGATAVRAELDLMETALGNAKSSLRALETLVEMQSARLETVRALVSTPGVTCDDSVAAASRLAEAMLATRTTPAFGSRSSFVPSRSMSVDRPTTHRDVSGETPFDSGANPSRITPDRASRSAAMVSLTKTREIASGPSVARRLDEWEDHLRLTGAVRLETGVEPTSIATFPQRNEGHEKEFPRYFAVGDDRGGVRVLRSDGDVALTLPDAFEVEAEEASAAAAGASARRRLEVGARSKSITRLVAAYRRKNETTLVAGTASGGVVFYQIFETAPEDESTRGVEDRTLAGTVYASYALRRVTAEHSRGVVVQTKRRHWEKERTRARRRRLERVKRGVTDRNVHLEDSVRDGAEEKEEKRDEDLEELATFGSIHPQGVADAFDANADASETNPDASSETFEITAVANYRLNDGKNYVVVADSSGKIVLFTDRGASVHSVYRIPPGDFGTFGETRTVERVVQFKPSRRSISWVTGFGAGSLDPATFAMRQTRCAGLETNPVVSVAFDAQHTSRFYGTLENGEAVHGALAGVDVSAGAGVRASCAVKRPARGVDVVRTGDMDVPRAFAYASATVKGYAFMGFGARVSVWNVTGVGAASAGAGARRAPREIAVADVFGLANAFGGREETERAALGEESFDASIAPVAPYGCRAVAADIRGTFVAMTLPGGFVAIYENALAVRRPDRVRTTLWNQPLFVLAMGLLAWYQFHRQKNASRRGSASGSGFGFGDGASGSDAETRRLFERAAKTRGADGSGYGYGKRETSGFDARAFRKQMERDGKWERRHSPSSE